MVYKSPTLTQQEQAAQYLRGLLKEGGHLIFKLARRLRPHRLDFIALPKANVRQFVIVRAVRSGLSLQTFYCPGVYTAVRRNARRTQSSYGIRVYWRKQIPLARTHAQVEHYLPPKAQKELRFLAS